jgi:hypothetical protein
MRATIKILDWRSMRKNSLLGFAKTEMPSGMVISDVTVLVGANGPWASPPSKPSFSNGVIEALRLAHPEAFT